MKLSVVRLITAVVLAVASGGVVFAEPITITADRRLVGAIAGSANTLVRASDTLTTTATTPAGQGPGVASARMASSFSNPMRWIGTGSASIATNGPEFILGYAVFETDFVVTSPVTYKFDGTFDASRSASRGNVSDSVLAALSVDTFRDEDGEQLGPTVFARYNPMPDPGRSGSIQSATGLLMPGKYSFFLNGSASHLSSTPGTAESSFAFTMDFAPADVAPVPEPTSMLLLGSGLAGLFYRYRRRSVDRQ